MSNDTKQIEEAKAKRTAKNSVFLDLFQNKSYLLKLYKTLHPEDATATEDSLTDVTITNVLTDNLYNDLGFIANNKLMILVEAQSTWTVNILVRVLLYLAQSYHEYFQRTCQDYYKSKKVKMPKPELYVIFTGNKGRKPDKILLSKEFFEGADIDIEVRAKVIYESDTDDIINQYMVFNEQTKQHGMTRKAVTETIRICKDRNVLGEYLLEREKEVVTIMMSLFDEEQIMKSFIRSERHEAVQDKVKEKAILMLQKGKISIDEIQTFFPELSDEEIEVVKGEVMQLA